MNLFGRWENGESVSAWRWFYHVIDRIIKRYFFYSLLRFILSSFISELHTKFTVIIIINFVILNKKWINRLTLNNILLDKHISIHNKINDYLYLRFMSLMFVHSLFEIALSWWYQIIIKSKPKIKSNLSFSLHFKT